MGIINRPLKTGGNRTYVLEVDAGHTDIIDLEIDEDFRVIYDEFNGHISNANIDPLAAIQYSKLDLYHSLKGSDFDPTNTVPIPPTFFPPGGTTGIPGGAIQDHTIGPLQLFAARGDHSGTPGTTSPAPFITEVGNLGLFTSVMLGTPVSSRNDGVFMVGTTEQLAVDVGFTTRGGPILIWGECYLLVENLDSAVAGGVACTGRIRGGQNGGTVGGVDGDILVTRQMQSIGVPSGTFGPFPFRIPVTLMLNHTYSTILSSYAGAVRFKLTLQAPAVSTTAKSTHYGSSIIVVELA